MINTGSAPAEWAAGSDATATFRYCIKTCPMRLSSFQRARPSGDYENGHQPHSHSSSSRPARLGEIKWVMSMKGNDSCIILILFIFCTFSDITNWFWESSVDVCCMNRMAADSVMSLIYVWNRYVLPGLFFCCQSLMYKAVSLSPVMKNGNLISIRMKNC